MATRYKIIGATGMDDNDGRGYSRRQAEVELEAWEDASPDDPTITTVPLNGPNRTSGKKADEYRAALDRRLRRE